MKLKISKKSAFLESSDQIQVGSYLMSISGFDDFIVESETFKVLLSGDIYRKKNETIEDLNKLVASEASVNEIIKRIKESTKTA